MRACAILFFTAGGIWLLLILLLVRPTGGMLSWVRCAVSCLLGTSLAAWSLPVFFIITDPYIDPMDVFSFIFAGMLVFVEGRHAVQKHFTKKAWDEAKWLALCVRFICFFAAVGCMMAFSWRFAINPETTESTVWISLITLSLAVLQFLHLHRLWRRIKASAPSAHEFRCTYNCTYCHCTRVDWVIFIVLLVANLALLGCSIAGLCVHSAHSKEVMHFCAVVASIFYWLAYHHPK